MHPHTPIPRPSYDKGLHAGLHQKKATLVAFFPLPVALAFLVSLLSILTMITFQPATRVDASNDRPADFSSPNDSQPSASISHNSSKFATSISPIFTEEVRYWDEAISAWSERYQLEPNLIAILMQIESCGYPSARSPAGATGLFQVMPYHFANDEEPFDPDTNAQRGLSYFKRALQLAGDDASLAFAGYNGGHGVIKKEPAYWPAETRRYVYWGSGIMADIQAGRSHSPRLDEWLAAGGKSLCSLAATALELDR